MLIQGLLGEVGILYVLDVLEDGLPREERLRATGPTSEGLEPLLDLPGQPEYERSTHPGPPGVVITVDACYTSIA